MKKTLSINLSGSIFLFDEDAYYILDNYLKSLHSHFEHNPESNELMEDFERRISELLNETATQGVQGEKIVGKAQVEEVIGRMGDPKDIFDDEEPSKETNKSRSHTQTKETGSETKKKLFRNPDDKVLGGVCSGLATYWGVDAILIRIIAVIFALSSCMTFCLLYIICWLLMPEARTAVDKMRMRGETITVESIGQTVRNEAQTYPPYAERKEVRADGCLGTTVKIIGAGGLIILSPIILAIVIAIIAICFALIFGIPLSIIEPFTDGGVFNFGSFPYLNIFNMNIGEQILYGAALFTFLFIPIFTLVRLFSRDKEKGMQGWIKVLLLILWILSVLVLGFGSFDLIWHMVN